MHLNATWAYNGTCQGCMSKVRFKNMSINLVSLNR